MPIYEYLCEDCAYKFELKQSIKDEPVAACTRCGKSVGRIISAPAIMFKGSGWYITDYSDKMKPPTTQSPDPASGTKKEAAESSSAPPAAPAVATTATASTSSSGSGSTTPSASTGTSSSERSSSSK